MCAVASVHWKALLAGPQPLPPWDKDLRTLSLDEYRMRDRFFVVACVLDFANASQDAMDFIRINDMRSGYYHRMEARDRDLPTNDARSLFRLAFQGGHAAQSLQA
jgi:hypothetical protein